MNWEKEQIIRDVLNQNIVIPETVMHRVQETYRQVKPEQELYNEKEYIKRSTNRNDYRSEKQNEKRYEKRIRITKYFIAATVAVLAGGSVYAAIHWNRGLEVQLQIAERQKERLESERMLETIDQSCTIGDVTVTVDQCIVDNYFAYLSFNIKGYQLPENMEPCFEEIQCSIDGRQDFSAGGSFYNGIIMGPDGRAIYADGSEINWNSDGSGMILRYQQEDGSMQFLWTVSSGGEKGILLGKEIHVELKNLGTVKRAQYFPDLEGTWTFDWLLPDSAPAKEIELEHALGDTGAVVKTAELSPVSLYVTMDFPRQEMTEIYETKDGKTETFTFWKDAPRLTGVRLKDGTLLPYITDKGGLGYLEEEGTLYFQRYALDRVIDEKQIDALLFYKSGFESGKLPTEENFYVVPVS